MSVLYIIYYTQAEDNYVVGHNMDSSEAIHLLCNTGLGRLSSGSDDAFPFSAYVAPRCTLHQRSSNFSQDNRLAACLGQITNVGVCLCSGLFTFHPVSFMVIQSVIILKSSANTTQSVYPWLHTHTSLRVNLLSDPFPSLTSTKC